MRLLLAGLTTLTGTTASRHVHAEDESAASKVVPPRSIDAGRAPYPSTGHGDTEVVLILGVGADGHVEEVEIASGTEPFTAAAREAAVGWSFEPARRDGEAVAARIRMRVVFEEPVPEVSPSPPAPDTSPGMSAPPPPGATTPSAPSPSSVDVAARKANERVEEVLVRGDTNDPVRTVISPTETRRIPGAFGDPFRAVDAFAGVTPIVSGLPYFFIRSAPPGNTGYYLDDIQVPTLYHVGFGPGVLNPALVGDVELHLGAAPARFGHIAGGVISAESRAPLSKLHGAATARLYDAGGYVEAPFADGRASALVGGRYSIAGPVLGLVTNDVRLAYWDYQARTTWEPAVGGRFTLLAFGSNDVLEQRDDQTNVLQRTGGGEFHRVDLRYDRDDGDNRFQVATTVGVDSGSMSKLRGSKQRLQTRARIERIMSPSVRARFGVDFTHDAYQLVSTAGTNDEDVLFLAALSRPRNELTAGLWADVSLHTDVIDITPGVRVDRYETRTTGPLVSAGVDPLFTVEPRLSARAPLSRRITALLTMGIAHQRPSYFIPIYGISPLINGATLQTAYQLSQGIEMKLPFGMSATATGFYHLYSAMTDASFTCGSDFSFAKNHRLGCLGHTTDGRAFGAELGLRRALSERVGGVLSYTLSRATRANDIPSGYDRPHVLSAVLSLDLGGGYVTGARFSGYSGHPYSRTAERADGTKDPIPPINRERLEAFYRLDLRIEKRLTIGRHVTGAIVLEGLNVLARKEAYAVGCSPNGSICNPKRIGPLTIPNVSLELAF